MQYSAAFEELGYKLENVRQDWSAENADGVCITIWKRRINWDEMFYDTRIGRTPIDVWKDKSGNTKRIAHAKRSLKDLDGWVDAILISGAPEKGSYEDAQIWIPAEKGGKRWRVVFLDEATGHIRLEAQRL